jgi:hypothetical protein
MKIQEGFVILKYSSKNVQIVVAISLDQSPVRICPIIAGKVTNDTAKIIGIIHAWFTLIGKYDFSSLPVLV